MKGLGIRLGATAVLVLVAFPLLAQTESRLRTEVAQLVVPDAFGAVRSIQVGPEGDVHVVFAGPPIVRRWIAATEEWQVIPLAGAPDTFVPARLGWSGNRLWAMDRRQTALWRDGHTGSEPSFQEVYLPRPGSGPKSFRVLAVDQAGRLIVRTSVALNSMAAADPRSSGVFENLPPAIEPPRPVDSLPVWMAQSNGVVVDTVAMVSTANHAMVLPTSSRLDASGTGRIEMIVRAQPVRDDPIIVAGPTGSLVIVERPAEHTGSPPSFRLRAFNPDGGAAAVHSLPYVPVAVRSGWADSTIAALASDLVERGDDVITARETASTMLYQPAALPPISTAHVGPGAWTWVRRYGLNPGGEQDWEVINPAGTRVGVVSLDARIEVRAVNGRTAWATTSDDSRAGTILRIDLRRLTPVPE